MKKYSMNTIIFFLIIVMSIIIFTLAFSALHFFGGPKEKDVDFFSDDYFICDFGEDKVSMEEVLKKLDRECVTQIAFVDGTVGYVYIKMTDEFFEYYGFEAIECGQRNIVFVNEKYKSQCYKDENNLRININGITYDVEGFYEEQGINKKTVCYINADSKASGNLTLYSYMVIDTQGDQKENIKRSILNSYRNIEIIDWNGKLYGISYNNNMYFYIVFLCGIVLCVNCLNFSNVWVRSYTAEMAVRRLVGANSMLNYCFLIKEYLKLLLKSVLFAEIILKIIYWIIGKSNSLIYVQNIFGKQPGMKATITGIFVVLIVTKIMVNLTYFSVKIKR